MLETSKDVNIMDESTKQEINFIREALLLLQQESNWTKEGEFDDKCEQVIGPYSLSCALKVAQNKIKGKFESRSKAMNKLRIIIYSDFFCRAKHHPIYYFNKHSKTKHSEIILVLQKTIKKLV